MRAIIFLAALLAIGCNKPEIVENETIPYFVTKEVQDDGTIVYQELWLPEQHEGFFTDNGFANGSGKAYSAFALAEGDTIRVMYRHNVHGRGFHAVNAVYDVKDVGNGRLEIWFDTPCFKNVTATFKYNRTFYYQID